MDRNFLKIISLILIILFLLPAAGCINNTNQNQPNNTNPPDGDQFKEQVITTLDNHGVENARRFNDKYNISGVEEDLTEKEITLAQMHDQNPDIVQKYMNGTDRDDPEWEQKVHKVLEGDLDNDTLTNTEEVLDYGSDPAQKSTAGDGISDLTKVKYDLDLDKQYSEDFAEVLHEVKGDGELAKTFANLFSNYDENSRLQEGLGCLTEMKSSTIKQVLGQLKSTDQLKNKTLKNIQLLKRHPEYIDKNITDADWDKDGLNNLREVEKANSDPTQKSTAGDGISDLTKVKYNLDLEKQYSEDFAEVLNQIKDKEQLAEEFADLFSNYEEDERVQEGLEELLEFDSIGEKELDFVNYTLSNPELKEQIEDQNYTEDGKITSDELNSTRDPDEDRLINAIENEIGIDPHSKDTDMDGLPDSWEYKEAVLIEDTPKGPVDNYNEVPLPGADPLHKDLYLRIMPIDGNITKSKENDFEQLLADIPCRNPDGNTGIDLHVSYQEDAQKYKGKMNYPGFANETGFVTIWNVTDHDLWGAYYFMKLEKMPSSFMGGAINDHFVSWMNTEKDRTPVRIMGHELLHNIEGSDRTLGGGDPVLSNDNLAAGINQTGINGLPRTLPDSVKYGLDGGKWGETSWKLPE